MQSEIVHDIEIAVPAVGDVPAVGAEEYDAHETAVRVRGLRKVFQVKHKAPGLRGSLAALWQTQTQTVLAVEDVNFAMRKGEMLAFIGPNGAGKSTTIKMLTGILYPSGGAATVLGYTPWQERRQLAYHIGSVFGQKPQLWYHLPAEDTFQLFARIYELDMVQFRRRRGFLVEAFQLHDLLNIPVRKLSLGQRMKCEIAASLLHGPRIVFLDEPTIGLDVIAKQQIREAIRTLNQEEGTTIFLTSHDTGDMESLCDRVVIINHGRVIFDAGMAELKRRYLRRKVIEVHFADGDASLGDGVGSRAEATAFAMPGVSVLQQDAFGMRLAFDSYRVPVDSVLQAVIATRPCTDITVTDPPLEEAIRRIYSE
ncbi:MAG: ATP-binding cassette domain-containing protein [Litorilinea sp.]